MECSLDRNGVNVKSWIVVATEAGEGEIETGFGPDAPFEVFITPWLANGELHVNEYTGTDSVGLICTAPGAWRVIAIRNS